MDVGQHRVVTPSAIDALIRALREHRYEVVGPRVQDGAIACDLVESTADLPRGAGDEQDGGRYRLRKRDDDALFGYAVGPQSWKRLFHPPTLTLWRARAGDARFEFSATRAPGPRALLGVRACDLAAIAIQDRVLLGGAYVDRAYESRRKGTFVVAVNCSEPGGTCFCASMRTGPRVRSGFDLLLTEILGDGDGPRGHRFLMEVGSTEGGAIAASLESLPATDEDLAAVEAVLARAESSMGRTLETEGLKERLYRDYESPRWNAIADRCLACANCTMVCPTCFCVSVEDVADLSGDEAERRRRWDSCFTADFSYVHGGSVRTSVGARYRQWLTHKLATWQDQFGEPGCVGCGRCITWCPVGIDITVEAGGRDGPGREGARP
jgi:sulfhydrogenase subunit beta (sulfur reductase)